MSKRKSI